MLVLFIGSAYSMEVAKTLNLNVVKKLLYDADNTLRFISSHQIRRTIYTGVQMGSRYDVLSILSHYGEVIDPKTVTLEMLLS